MTDLLTSPGRQPRARRIPRQVSPPDALNDVVELLCSLNNPGSASMNRLVAREKSEKSIPEPGEPQIRPIHHLAPTQCCCP